MFQIVCNYCEECRPVRYMRRARLRAPISPKTDATRPTIVRRWTDLLSSGQGHESALIRDRRGNVVILTAIALTVFVGAAALTVDLGSLSHERRNLQSSNDAAAMAAVVPILQAQTYQTTPDTSRLNAIITAALAGNGYSNAVIDSAVAGTYCPDPSLTPSARFTVGAATCSNSVYTGPVPNAVQSVVHVQSPYFFGRVLNSAQSGEAIGATSLAVGMDEAGFIIGTGLISASTANSPILNAVMGGMLGSNLGLSAVNYDGLANAEMNGFTFLSAVATNPAVNSATIGGLNTATASLWNVLEAEITALNAAGASASAISGAQLLAAAVTGQPSLTVGQLLNTSTWQIAPTSSSAAPTALSASVNAFQVASAAIQLSNAGKAVTIPTAGLSLPGLSSLTIAGTAGSASQTAYPGGGLGFVGTGASTSQVNMTLGIQVTPVAINLGAASATTSLSMPTTVTVASGTALLNSISCGANSATDASLTIVGTTGLATIDTTLTTNVSIKLLGISVLQANVVVPMTVTVGSGGPTTLTFTQADIASQNVKRISSTDVLATTTSSLASSLASQTSAKINVLVLGISLPAGFLTQLTSGISSALSATIAPLLDTVINNVTAALGIQVGYMDVMATGVRCGVPAIVD